MGITILSCWQHITATPIVKKFKSKRSKKVTTYISPTTPLSGSKPKQASKPKVRAHGRI